MPASCSYYHFMEVCLFTDLARRFASILEKTMLQSINFRSGILLAFLLFPAYAAGTDRETPSPIILRLNTFSLNEQRLPSTARVSENTAKEVFWLGITALLTFGVPLLDLPEVLDRGEANARPIRECLESWDEIRNGPNSWLKSADMRAFALQTLQQEVARLMASSGRPVEVKTESSDTKRPTEKPAIAGDVVGAARYPSFRANVSIVIDPSSSGQCGADFGVSANLQSQTHATDFSPSSPSELINVGTISAAEAVDVHAWARDPEVGRKALRLALGQLANAIAEAYRRSMGEEGFQPLPSNENQPNDADR